jgi:hypothetical protein
MKTIILASLLASVIVSAAAVSAQAYTVGSSAWWQEMDREGRGGQSQ